MRTTAIFSYKGGTGKTTTAINLAAELARRGKRVVLVDADGQRNTSEFFGADCDGATTATIYELLSGAEPCYENLIQETQYDNLRILPASERLATAELEKALTGQGVRLTALCDFCEALAEDDEADFVLIDCPPSFAPQTVAALIAADDVIVPVTLDSWAVSGLRDLLTSLDGIHRSNMRLRLAGVLVSRRDASAVSRDAEAALRKSGYRVFQTAIRSSALVARSTFAHVPVIVKNPFSALADDFARLCREYLKGGASNV